MSGVMSYLFLLIREMVIEGLSCVKSMLWGHSPNLAGKGSLCSQDAYTLILTVFGRGLTWWLSCKESACQCRRHGFEPWVGISAGEGNGNPL